VDVEDFVAWVRRNGVPADVNIVETAAARSSVIGILAMANGQRITPSLITAAARFAQDSKMDPSTLVELLRVGELLLQFQRSLTPEGTEDATPPPDARPPESAAGIRRATPVVSPATSPLRTLTPVAVQVRTPVPLPAGARTPTPVSGTVRTPMPATIPARTPAPATLPRALEPSGATGAQSLASSQVPEQETAVAAAQAAPEAAAEPPRRRHRILLWTVAGSAALAILAGAGLGLQHHIASERAKAAAAEAARPDPIFQQALDLTVSLPSGWSHYERSGQSSTLPGGTMKAALLHRGEPGSATHNAFVGVLPLTGDLSKGTEMSDGALLGATHNGEMVMGLELAGVNVPHESSGCQLIQLAGRRTGRCAAMASLGADRYTLRTYLSVGLDRAVLFVFTARSDLPVATADEEALVARIETAVPL